jgi:archaellum biogenesis ATPase FlaH
MAAKKIRLRHWDPSTMKPTSTIIILGKRGTGKSTIIRDLCYRLRDKVDAAVAFSPTEDAQGSLGQFIPTSCIHEEFNDGLLESVLDAQRAYLKRGRDRHVLVIADDVAYDKSAFRGKAIRNTFMNGRHRKTGIILTAQYAMDMDVAIRSNADIIIAARETVVQNQEKLWKSFFGHFSKLTDFVKCFKQCTNNYEVMVCVNNTSSTDLEDSIFWWKADVDLPDFRLGSSAQWTLHNRFHVDEDPDPDGTGVEKLQ